MDSTREYESAAAHQHSKRRREEDTHQQPDKFIIVGGKYLRFALDIEKEIVPCVAKFVQKLVREEMERFLRLRQTMNETGAHVVKSFELVFKNDLPATVFTHSNIKAKDGSPIQIALYDARSQLIVTDDPLLSSIKVKIYVLKGEFGGDENENWSTKEFKANISRERENRGELLKGDTVITLKNGVGYIGKIMFTDNSKCTWSRHFRLGAIVSSTSHQATIKEAISNPFIVKDSRGDLNQKQYPPSLNDEVYRLENISKGGKIHERLLEIGIKTVKDLLQLYETNPTLLQEKFGKLSRKLKGTIDHANTYTTEEVMISHGQNDMPLQCNLQVLDQYLPSDQYFDNN
ncbi:hypothetical protein AHAS_Ahas06G0046900 [Arachis hypogaea]